MTPHSTYLPPHLAALFAHARTDFRPLRSLAAQEIERLIDFLDALDGDTDLEADADIEQDVGEMPESEAFNRNLDDEPSLGSLGGTAAARGCSQLNWSFGSLEDGEAQPEDDDDVTAPERYGAGFRRAGLDDAEDGHDAEGFTDDNGMADCGGRDEQFARHDRHLARLAAIANAEATDRRAPRLRLTVGGAA